MPPTNPAYRVVRPVLGRLKFLASDAELLSKIETPVRPRPPSTVPQYRVIFFRSLVEGKKL